jgi:hypothetical protein
MLDSKSKAILTLGGLVLVGGGIYYFLSQRKERGNTIDSSSILTVSKPSSADTFAIYTAKDDIKEVNKRLKAKGSTANEMNYVGLGRTDINFAKVGDKVKITGGGGLNGVFEVSRIWNLTGKPNTMVAMTLKNKGQWDGKEPNNKTYLNSKGTHFWFEEKAPIVTIQK